MRVKFLSVKQGKELMIGEFPNFHKSGSIKGMKEMYYGKDALLVKCGQYIYYLGNLKRDSSQILTRGETIYFHNAK